MKERDMKYLIGKVKALPERSGVYLMKGHEGQIIYIGKSKNLRNRVSQYFHEAPKDSKKLQRLTKSIYDFEIIYTDTEFEALILEARMIQAFRPEYNSLVKKYKKYVYLKLTIQEKYPRFQIVGDIDEDGSLIYGPYKDEHGLTDILNIFYQYYFLRRCSKNLITANDQSCSHYALRQCLGPCRKEYEGNYEENLNPIIDILEGRGEAILEKIKLRMVEEAEKQHFEKAAVLRNELKSMEHFLRYQQMLSFLTGTEQITAVEETIEGWTKIHRIQRGRLAYSEIAESENLTGHGDCTCCHAWFWRDRGPVPVSQIRCLTKETLDEALIIYHWISREKFKAVFYNVSKQRK